MTGTGTRSTESRTTSAASPRRRRKTSNPYDIRRNERANRRGESPSDGGRKHVDSYNLRHHGSRGPVDRELHGWGTVRLPDQRDDNDHLRLGWPAAHHAETNGGGAGADSQLVRHSRSDGETGRGFKQPASRVRGGDRADRLDA